jgi:hypothetical protein
MPGINHLLGERERPKQPISKMLAFTLLDRKALWRPKNRLPGRMTARGGLQQAAEPTSRYGRLIGAPPRARRARR